MNNSNTFSVYANEHQFLEFPNRGDYIGWGRGKDQLKMSMRQHVRSRKPRSGLIKVTGEPKTVN